MGEKMISNNEEFEKEYPYNLLTHYLIEGNKITQDMPYEIEEISARKLLTPERIDLMAKWFYIDSKVHGVDMAYAKELYAKHIEAFSEGTFTEPGTEEKNSIEKYYCTFDKLIEDIRVNGFDSQKSLIPIGQDNILLDGSHRCACAAYFDKKVKVIHFTGIQKDYGTGFFKKRFLDDEILDQMVELYCRVQKNVYCACFWPVGDVALLDEAEAILQKECGKIIYSRKIRLSYTALRNFMIQIYGHQAWTGTRENGHGGVDSKVEACYANRELQTIFFHCDSLEKVLSAKSSIRELYKIENHSVHISDTDQETRMMAGILLNRNSRHFLEYGKIDFSRELNQVVKKIKDGSLGDREKVMMLPEATMAAYGLKEIVDGAAEIFIEDEEHTKQFLVTNGVEWKKYFYNPQCYFMLNDVKFIALPEVKKLKVHCVDKESLKEVREMNKLLRGTENGRRKQKNKSGYGLKRKKSMWEHIKEKIISMTQKLHIYEEMLKIYHHMRK